MTKSSFYERSFAKMLTLNNFVAIKFSFILRISQFFRFSAFWPNFNTHLFFCLKKKCKNKWVTLTFPKIYRFSDFRFRVLGRTIFFEILFYIIHPPFQVVLVNSEGNKKVASILSKNFESIFFVITTFYNDCEI